MVVDTGFTGHLALRPETVERLALSVIGSAESILANGSTTVEDFCLARVFWHGTPGSVRALVVDAVPLLGMSCCAATNCASRPYPVARSSCVRCLESCGQEGKVLFLSTV